MRAVRAAVELVTCRHFAVSSHYIKLAIWPQSWCRSIFISKWNIIEFFCMAKFLSSFFGM